jgi:hypothetical protein
MLNLEILAADLDFAIGETGKPLVGVSPAAIAGLTYNGCLSSIEDGYEVELAGRDVILDAEILINGNANVTLPTKGAILKDLDGTHHKVYDVTKEDFGPGYRLRVVSRYASGD